MVASSRSSRHWLIGSSLLSTLVASLVQHTVAAHAPKEDLSTVISASGESPKPRLVRRQAGSEAILVDRGGVKAATTATAAQPDLYVMIGHNKCNGGGAWKRYEMNGVTPGRYEVCAAACNAKDECIGFDVGSTGCNLYTQKAVAVGTWPTVRFSCGGPVAGEGAHDKFPQTPTDLTAGTTALPAGETFQCYRKTYYKPADSYYWLIGNGTCSGGGLWKRYAMSPGDYDTCEHACNQRDECIGFDVGTWEVSDITEQVFMDKFKTSLQTTTGCFMYTQKAVYGTWPGVQDGDDEAAWLGDGNHDAWPSKPADLTAGHVERFDADATAKCYGKTHYVSLDQYYMQLGNTLCSGGGTWKHYKMTGASLEDCKLKCDAKDACVGLDHEENTECRLYSRLAMPGSSSTWDGVEFKDGVGPWPGTGDHDAFAPTPFSLKPEELAAGTAVDHTKTCLAKTHFETPDQALCSSDTR